IPCGRPPGCESLTPLSLLHPIFGEFLDDCQKHEPTVGDAALARDFVTEMGKIHRDELTRQTALKELLDKHNIHTNEIELTNSRYGAGLTVTSPGGTSAIGEINNDIGSTGAEPLFQASLYYLEATQRKALEVTHSALPCILVLVFGPYIAFAGAAWSERPVVQMLSPAIPCHYHTTDLNLENMLVRHLGAFRKALHSLQTFYARPPDDLSPYPACPYKTSITVKKGDSDQVVKFAYQDRMKHHNVFFGNIRIQDDSMQDKDADPVCIKFVTRYCQDAHELLAREGLAPKLIGVERLPGGLYAVIMEDFGDNYINLFHYIEEHKDFRTSQQYAASRNAFEDRFKAGLNKLHDAGLVHGDVRNTNILVDKNSPDLAGAFYLIDYDWSGKDGEVKYPLTLNTKSVKRPDGAIGSGFIQKDHDIAMVKYLWKLTSYEES
ncbi:hypothetical protein BDN72DRAFT_775561, partial [Pluteus cervinus]